MDGCSSWLIQVILGLSGIMQVCIGDVGSADGSAKGEDELRYDPYCPRKYMAFSATHTACLDVKYKPLTLKDQDLILREHNRYRRKISWGGGQQPKAQNMLKMSWDDDLAMLASKWAATCLLKHDTNVQRFLPGRFDVGQNIAFGHFTWGQAIKGWYDEVQHFEFEKGSKTEKQVGHYTQLVWAETTKVGCGIGFCNHNPLYVCDYGPSGNIGKERYRPYDKGPTASACADVFQDDGLCDCSGKICKNGGTLNLRTCQCDCKTSMWINDPQLNCSMDCEAAADVMACKTRGGDWGENYCSQFMNVPYQYCPIMCNVCPANSTHFYNGVETVDPVRPSEEGHSEAGSGTDESTVSSGRPVSPTQPTESVARILPKSTCDVKYFAYSKTHTACLDVDWTGISVEERKLIIEDHNSYRRKVAKGDTDQPGAANMIELEWDTELEMLAGKWAHYCDLSHDKLQDRAIPGRFGVGQNIAVASIQAGWSLVISTWYNEVEHFQYGVGSSNHRNVGHYTQMMWANTSHIGCSAAVCKTKKYFVCDYGPSGNVGKGVNHPYKMRKVDEPLTCAVEFQKDGLCDCSGRICYNGGKLNLKTCECECKVNSPWISNPETNCSMDCSEAIDIHMCGTRGGPWPVDDCYKFGNLGYEFCPIMCNLCPVDENTFFNGVVIPTKPPTVKAAVELPTIGSGSGESSGSGSGSDPDTASTIPPIVATRTEEETTTTIPPTAETTPSETTTTVTVTQTESREVNLIKEVVEFIPPTPEPTTTTVLITTPATTTALPKTTRPATKKPPSVLQTCHGGTWRRLDFYSRDYINVTAPIRTDHTHPPDRCLFGSHVEIQVPHLLWQRLVKKKRRYYLDFEVGYMGLTTTIQGVHIKTQFVKALRTEVSNDGVAWDLVEETYIPAWWLITHTRFNFKSLKCKRKCSGLKAKKLRIVFISRSLWRAPKIRGVLFNTCYIHKDLAPPSLECAQTKKGFEYSGSLNVTTSGLPCNKWNVYSGLKLERKFPDRNMMEAENYCRNVRRKGRRRVWCLVEGGAKQWEYCTLPSCSPAGEAVKTFDADSHGDYCVFPFIYNGKRYFDCTDDDGIKPWCGTTNNFDRDNKWGWCLSTKRISTIAGTANGAPCHFPFQYKGVLYGTCIRYYGPLGAWCGTTADVDTDKLWGYCDVKP